MPKYGLAFRALIRYYAFIMIIYRDQLNETELNSLAALWEAGNALEAHPYSLPEDADIFLLYYGEDGMDAQKGLAEIEKAEETAVGTEPGELVAALCIYHMGDTKDGKPIDEICAMTHPAWRRRGCFTALFSMAKALLRPVLRFGVYPSPSPAGKAGGGRESGGAGDAETFLEHLGAEFTHKEQFMTLPLPDPCFKAETEPLELTIREEAEGSGSDSDSAPSATLTVTCPFGECYLTLFGSRAYLFGVLIYRRFRGQGYGYRMLHALLSRLPERGIREVFLEVSSENLPAVRLYEKLGFAVSESLAYYILELPEEGA